jgi:hypothetical protein
MEKDFPKGHFEELLREKTGEYKMYPTERVWNSIYHRLHTRRKWHFIGGGTFALLILAGLFVLVQDNDHAPSKTYVRPKSFTYWKKPSTRNAGSELASIQNAARNNSKANNGFRLGEVSSSSEGTGLQAPVPGWGSYLPTPHSLLLSSDYTTVSSNNSVSKQPSLPEESILAGTSSEASATEAKTQGASLLKMTENGPQLGGMQKETFLNHTALATGTKKVAAPASRYSWLFHLEPSVSFRALRTKTAIMQNGTLVYDNQAYNINSLVDQRPSFGFELGADVLYSLTSKLRLKAGVQFNYSRYDAKAVTTAPQTVNIPLGGSAGLPASTASASTSYGNGDGQPNASAIWIPNQRVELSLPVGAEYQLAKGSNFTWNVASTIQPTYILNSNAYLLSADTRAYAQDPNLLRRWNADLGLETFLRFQKGDVQIQIGPQFRYQLLPSFINSYNIVEHLYDVGFKIGVTRTFR